MYYGYMFDYARKLMIKKNKTLMARNRRAGRRAVFVTLFREEGGRGVFISHPQRGSARRTRTADYVMPTTKRKKRIVYV